jgi:carboxymethylenebutenolidase
MPNVTIPTPHGQMPAWLAGPASTVPVPGVVVLHDVFGMSQDHRNQANWLAEAGFLAVAPDLYYKGNRFTCVRTVIREMIARSGPAFDDVEAARGWLLAQPGCNGKVGTIGFCMGGGFALLLASGHGFSASSVNYGGPLPADVDDFLQTACPLVVSYGGQAKWEAGVAHILEQKLARALVPHDVMEYPDAGHSFMNKHRGYGVFKVLRFKAVGYNEEAAKDARRRIAAFFRMHLDA